MASSSRPSSIPPGIGEDIYSGWELHKLAVLGLRRACIGGLLGFPAAFVTDVLMRESGLAADGLGEAALRVGTLTAITALVLLWATLRGDRLAHPFLVGTALMVCVGFFDALAAAPTGGFTSPYSFGLVPVLLTWALLMPGGVRFAIVPFVGAFAVYVFTLAVLLGGRFVLPEVASVLFFQSMGIACGIVCSEIIEIWRRRLATESATDSLTGLMSRSYLFQRLSQLCAVRQREPAPVSVVMLDLDHFKTVNDRYGHAAGDAVLRVTARTLSSVTRSGDLVGRIGGEEFVLVLDDCDRAKASTVAERIRQQVGSTPVLFAGNRLQVTISAGVATADTSASLDAGTLVLAADTALYESKAGGRNRVSLA